MEFFEVVKNRRSIRSFKNQPLTQEAINQLVDAARMAPSAGNAQSWAFVLATKPETKRALAAAALNQRWLEEAAAVFVVCADLKRAEDSYGERGKSLYSIQDTSAAVENILLAATSLGLGACWMGAFHEEEIAKVIKAPDGMRPVALIPVGVPNESPPRPKQTPIKRSSAPGDVLAEAYVLLWLQASLPGPEVRRALGNPEHDEFWAVSAEPHLFQEGSGFY